MVIRKIYERKKFLRARELDIKWRRFLFVGLAYGLCNLAVGFYLLIRGEMFWFTLYGFVNLPFMFLVLYKSNDYKSKIHYLLYGEKLPPNILLDGLKEDLFDFIVMIRDPEFRKILKKMLKSWKFGI